MIHGLRNEWETWAQMEARNRAEYIRAMHYAMRLAPPESCLLKLEDQCMAEYAAAVERLLDATASALGGSREDLTYCIKEGKVHWREHTYRAMTARAFGVEASLLPTS